MDLSIIIVNYNVKELIDQALVSIKRACESIQSEIFVVDNASTDGSAELIKRKHPDVELIANYQNNGFAAANNQALKMAQGRYILLINPDTIVQEDTFFVIIEFLKKHPECGMLGCKILNPDGSLQLTCRRSFPTPWVALTKIVGLSKLFPKSKLFARYNLTYLDPDETYEVEAISGSFMFFRREVIDDVGLLDESFFMYGEDLDWCYRIREAGWKIYYLSTTKIIHFKGESSKKSAIDLTLQFYKAMKLFVEKHYQHRYFHVPQWLLMVGIWLRALLSFLSIFITRSLPGIIDFVSLNLSMLLAIYLRFGHFNYLQSYLIVMLVYSLIWLTCLVLSGSYRVSKFSSLRTIYGILLGLIFNTSLTYFFNQYDYSRAVVIISGVLNVILLAGWRVSLKILARFQKAPFKEILGQTLLSRKAIIVASVKSGQQIVEKLKQNLDTGYDICGIVIPNNHKNLKQEVSVPVLGKIELLDSIIQETRAQEIIFSTEKIPYDQILEVMSRTKNKDVNFKLIPSSMDVIIGKASVEYIGDLPLVDIDYNLLKSTNIVLKRIFDIFVSFFLLALSLPEMLYLTIFKNARLNRKKIFTVNHNVVDIFELHGKALSQRQKRLPLFWSVLIGKLSLVGSKIVEKDDQVFEKKRIELKPGLTSLFGINETKSGTTGDFERYNLFYLKNYSLQLDIEILVKTLFKI